MNDEITPEKIRERIRKTISEAKKGNPFPEIMEHMLTQIAFEMYKSGWNDAHRSIEIYTKLSKELLNK